MKRISYTVVILYSKPKKEMKIFSSLFFDIIDTNNISINSIRKGDDLLWLRKFKLIMLSETSKNPVENRVITKDLNTKAKKDHTHDERYYKKIQVDEKLHLALDNTMTMTEYNQAVKDGKINEDTIYVVTDE